MEYIHVPSPDTVIEYTLNTLITHLESGEYTAWLLSGGSAIQLEVEVAKKLPLHDTSRLAITLIDERYGPFGHENENYSKLTAAGFPLPVARVLTGESGEATAKSFSATLDTILAEADYSLGIFGIGADGHTAGIKPHSPSVTSTATATFYKWDDYERITMTAGAITKLDEAIVYAMGSEKQTTLYSLLHEDLPLEAQPAQVLKSIKKSVLYTDNLL